jgi:hypothetical protein
MTGMTNCRGRGRGATFSSIVVFLGIVLGSPLVGVAAIVTITDVTQAEGNFGFTGFTFSVTATLEPQDFEGAAVTFSTADGTATAPTDYVPVVGGFLPFFTSGTQTITILVVGDLAVEPDETFFVNLSNSFGVNCAVSDCQGLGTILNDDVAVSVPEPATLLLLGTGLAGIVVRRGRRLR